MRWLLVLVGLVGCQTTEPFRGPDGSLYYETTCNGAARSMADCMDEAYYQCGGPYKVLDGDQATTGYFDTQTGSYSGGNYRSSGSSVAVVKRSLRYKCVNGTAPTH